MKRLVSILACTVFVLGVGCSTAASSSSAVVSSEASSAASAGASVSSSAASSGVAATGSEEVTLQGMTFSVDPAVWTDSGLSPGDSTDGGYLYTSAKQTGVMVVVSVETEEGVTANTTVEELKEKFEKDNIGGTITTGEVNGKPSITVRAADAVELTSGQTYDMEGIITVILVDGKLYQFGLLGVTGLDDYVEDFNALVNTAKFA